MEDCFFHRFGVDSIKFLRLVLFFKSWRHPTLLSTGPIQQTNGQVAAANITNLIFLQNHFFERVAKILKLVVGKIFPKTWRKEIEARWQWQAKKKLDLCPVPEFSVQCPSFLSLKTDTALDSMSNRVFLIHPSRHRVAKKGCPNHSAKKLKHFLKHFFFTFSRQNVFFLAASFLR
jgi:hypothetical protein